MECPTKAAEYDRQHQEAPRSGRKHKGAIVLASQYTQGACGRFKCAVCSQVNTYVNWFSLVLRKASTGNNIRFHICCIQCNPSVSTVP